MFDHNIFRRPGRGGLLREKMVRETNPGVWEGGGTEAPHAKDHGYKTIATS